MKISYILPFLLVFTINLAAQLNPHPFPYISNIYQGIMDNSNQEQHPDNWHTLMQTFRKERAGLSAANRFPGIKKQALDSMNYYTYWDNSASLHLMEKQAFYFDTKGNLLTAIIYQMTDSLTQQMFPLVRFDFIYSRNNDLICETWSFRDTLDKWDPFYKSELFYEKEVLSAEIEYYYNEITQNWNNSWKSHFYYLGTDKLHKEVSYYWDMINACWDPNMKYEFSYLGIGKIWKENVYHWDPYYNHWDFVWFFESSYDSDFLLIEYKHVNVDPVNNNILFTDWKYNYSYYPDSERKNLIYLEWDEDSNEFRQLHKESYSYDALNNLDYMTSFFMSPDNTGWIPSDIFYCWYDNEFSLDNLVLPFILLEEEQADLMFRSKLTNVLLYEWNNLSGKWQHEGIYQLFYSEKSITSLDEVISDLSIYPNPVDDVLYIEGLSDQEYMYVIYDMLGNMLLKTEKIRNQEGIILSAIPEGAYILVLKDQQGKQYSTRIIVHH